MRFLKTASIAAASLVALGSASAQTPAIDTLYFVVREGVVMTAHGHAIDIDYDAEGNFRGRAAGTTFEGSYRLDGDQLCTTSSLASADTCTRYPEGKRPGDEFDVVSPTLGQVRIRIRLPEEP